MEAKPSFGYESQLQTDKVMTLSIMEDIFGKENSLIRSSQSGIG